MHVIITAIGSAGDINPMLMLACQLRERGHSVTFIANGFFENKVKAANLDFCALGDAELYHKATMDPDMWDPRKGFSAVWRTLNESLQLNLELIEQNLKQDTVLVGSTIAFASRVAQEKFAKKGSTVHLAPSCIISGCEPMAMPGLSLLPKLPLSVRQFCMSSIDKIWLDRVCRDDLNRFREKNGLAPVKSVMKTWMHSPDQVICAFPSWYATPQPDWPPNTVMTGFWIYDRPEDQNLTAELEGFLSCGEPPVVFTAGSAMAHSRKHFETAIAATKKSGLRAVLVSAYPEQIPKQLPPEIFYAPYAPFSVLFPRASIVVHHGGIGTSAQGLAAGVPAMVTPFAHDQFDNAFRLSKLGVANAVYKIDADQWAKSLTDLKARESVAVACHRTKTLIANSPSPERAAAEAIERLID
jgi:rhamnosyltransferase subunit B